MEISKIEKNISPTSNGLCEFLSLKHMVWSGEKEKLQRQPLQCVVEPHPWPLLCVVELHSWPSSLELGNSKVTGEGRMARSKAD